MCQVPKRTSSSACIGQLPQAVNAEPEVRRHGHTNSEALEGAHHPPARAESLQEARAAAVDGARTGQPERQGRAGWHTGGGARRHTQTRCGCCCPEENVGCRIRLTPVYMPQSNQEIFQILWVANQTTVFNSQESYNAAGVYVVEVTNLKLRSQALMCLILQLRYMRYDSYLQYESVL